MTIQDLGSIGELIAAIATIATLGYLAYQLKMNTAATRASSTTAHTEAVISVGVAITHSAEVNKLYWRGLADRAALDADERYRFDGLLAMQILTFEQTWNFYQDGVIDDAAWTGQRAALSAFAHRPGFIDYWRVYGAMHHAGFAAAVAKAMEEELLPELALAAQRSESAHPLRDESQA